MADRTVDELIRAISEHVATLDSPQETVMKCYHEASVTEHIDHGQHIHLKANVFSYNAHDVTFEKDGRPSLIPYWDATLARVRSAPYPGLAAEAIHEFQAAVLMYDRTLNPDGSAKPQRGHVLADLSGLMVQFCKPIPEPVLRRPLLPDRFSDDNQEALLAKIFSSVAENTAIYEHNRAGKFAEEMPFVTMLTMPVV